MTNSDVAFMGTGEKARESTRRTLSFLMFCLREMWSEICGEERVRFLFKLIARWEKSIPKVQKI